MTLSEEKEKLILHCKMLIGERIEKAEAELKSYAQQAGEETKSSAGDKYETARAMIHLEKEKMAHQLNEAMKLREVLDRVKTKPDASGFGKLLRTDQGTFFISISLGQVKCGGLDYFVISPVAPIGKLLQGAKAGDAIKFNGRTYSVAEIA